MVLSAFLAAIASILQSAGGLLPGVGFLISPFASLPIAVSAVQSTRSAWSSYALTIVLLTLLQPGELFIFPFTTGLLGLTLGWAFMKIKTRIFIIGVSAAVLFLGIMLLLYGLDFPVLGPAAAGSFQISAVLWIFVFCVVYSWIWVEICAVCFRKMNKI
jgi:hypothetical protein